jgi:hypothetical protein
MIRMRKEEGMGAEATEERRQKGSWPGVRQSTSIDPGYIKYMYVSLGGGVQYNFSWGRSQASELRDR